MVSKKKKMYYNYNIRTKGGFVDTLFLSSLILFIGILLIIILGGLK